MSTVSSQRKPLTKLEEKNLSYFAKDAEGGISAKVDENCFFIKNYLERS